MASKPSKYAHVVGDLKKYDGTDPDRKVLLQSVKDVILTVPDPEMLITGTYALAAMKAIGVNVEVVMTYLKQATRGQRQSSSLAHGYSDVRLFKEEVATWLSSVQLLVDAYEQLMLDQMEAEGLSSLKMESGASVSTFVEPYGEVVDKEAFRRWCVAPTDVCMDCGGREDASWHSKEPSDDPIIHHYHPGGGFERQLQLWPSTMNAITKERLLAGEPPPDGVEATAKTMIRLSKA